MSDQGGTSPRAVLVLSHAGRPAALVAAEELTRGLVRGGIHVIMPPDELATLDPAVRRLAAPAAPDDLIDGAELVVVLGGDGTILRAAEVVRGSEVPLLGVNLGHVGFLAEAERGDLAEVVHRIAERRYEVEQRMTLDVTVHRDGEPVAATWAVNEATVEKASRERMIEVSVDVDGRPLTAFGCDGVVLATPTGSTAYAFSAGGPVVWPEVEALLLVPISAHALFARPLVVAPTSTLSVEILDRTRHEAVLWCDGRRALTVPRRARVEVTRSALPVRLARLARPPFTDRLVAKFGLPAHGLKGDVPGPRGSAADGGVVPDGPSA
ncbi:MAG: NAD kinase [Actinomycetales bacterium]|nr:NAD kinase [Actinomycetales bacterium]